MNKGPIRTRLECGQEKSGFIQDWNKKFDLRLE